MIHNKKKLSIAESNILKSITRQYWFTFFLLQSSSQENLSSAKFWSLNKKKIKEKWPHTHTLYKLWWWTNEKNVHGKIFLFFIIRLFIIWMNSERKKTPTHTHTQEIYIWVIIIKSYFGLLSSWISCFFFFSYIGPHIDPNSMMCYRH